MALHGDRWQRPETRGTAALLLLADLVVLLAYVVGYVRFFEVILVYVVDTFVASATLCAKLLFVEPPDGRQSSRTLLSLDRSWLASPLTVTQWNVVRATHVYAGYLIAAALFWGLGLVLLYGVASAGGQDVSLAALSPERIAVATLGPALVHVVAFGRFVTSGQFGSEARETAEAQYGVAGTRSLMTALLAPFSLFLLWLPLSPDLVALLGFVAVKSGLDIYLGPEEVEAMDRA